MAYSFTDFLRDVDRELLTSIGKTSIDFPKYNFKADFDSQFPVAISAVEAIIQHGSISEVAKIDPDNICVFVSPYKD